MAFVSELISEEEKSKLNPESYRTRFGQSAALWKWSIDHERNAFLIGLGSQGPGDNNLYSFALTWNRNVIRVQGRMEAKGNNESGYHVQWALLPIELSSQLELHRIAVLQMIREALEAHGLYGNREIVSSMNVEIR